MQTNSKVTPKKLSKNKHHIAATQDPSESDASVKVDNATSKQKMKTKKKQRKLDDEIPVLTETEIDDSDEDNNDQSDSEQAPHSKEDKNRVRINFQQMPISGYCRKRIPGDGHCLFTSIGQALPQQLSAKEVRSRIYSTGLSNVQFYGGLTECSAGYGENSNDFQEIMRRNQQCMENEAIPPIWGNTIDVILATQVFNCDIYVYNSVHNETKAYSAKKGMLDLENFIVLHYNGTVSYTHLTLPTTPYV